MSVPSNEYDQPIGEPLAGWKARPSPPRTVMVGKWCRLEPLDLQRHARELFDAYQEAPDHRGWTYLPYGPFVEFDDYRGWMREECLGEDPMFFAVVTSPTSAALGVASYLRIAPPSGSIEVGHIHYAPRLQRTPAATEAMYLMMRRAFDELGYRRYEWKCDALNQISRHAAERLGFSFEGIFRQAAVYKERNRDTAWYAVVDREWPRVRAAFERWLDYSNFDDNGRQRLRLSDLMQRSQRG